MVLNCVGYFEQSDYHPINKYVNNWRIPVNSAKRIGSMHRAHLYWAPLSRMFLGRLDDEDLSQDYLILWHFQGEELLVVQRASFTRYMEDWDLICKYSLPTAVPYSVVSWCTPPLNGAIWIKSPKKFIRQWDCVRCSLLAFTPRVLF